MIKKMCLFIAYCLMYLSCSTYQSSEHKWSSNKLKSDYYENGNLSYVEFHNGTDYGFFMKFTKDGELRNEGIVCNNALFYKKIFIDYNENAYYLKGYSFDRVKDGLVETWVLFDNNNEKLEIDKSISSYVFVETDEVRTTVEGYTYFNPDSIVIKDDANILYTTTNILNDKISLDFVFEQEYQFKFIKNVYGGFEEYKILFDTDVGHLNSNDLLAANKLKKMIDADEIKSIMNEYEVFKK